MMTPRLRRFVFTVHVIVSVAWIGAVMAYLALDVTAATSRDISILRASYLSMNRIVSWAIVPLAVASLATGLIVSLGTKWGLFRHYWTLISFVLTVFAVVVLLIEARTIESLADVASDPTASSDAIRALPSTLVHSIGGLAVLIIITVLNVYKPRGLTRYGWRKHRAELEGQSTNEDPPPRPLSPR